MQNAALQRYNSFAGAVIDAALQGTLSSQENTTKSIRSDPISTTTVSSHLPPSLNLTGICDTNSSSSHQLKEYLNVLCAADNPSETGRKNAFMAWVGGKISVEFELVAKKLRLGVLEGFVRERWGDVGVRIVRVLLDKGKMDEKHVCAI